MKRIRLFIAIALVLLLSLSACNNQPNETNADFDYEKVEISKKLSEYDSPYTMCYENSDGTYTLFLYAAPVQYGTENKYSEIDNNIVFSSEEGYAFENTTNDIKTYFSENIEKGIKIKYKGDDLTVSLHNDEYQVAKLVEFENMHGDKVSAVNYCGKVFDVFFYLSNAGLRIEVIQDQIEYKPFDLEIRSSEKLGTSLFDDSLVIAIDNQEISAMGYSMLTLYESDNGEKELVRNLFDVADQFTDENKLNISLTPDEIAEKDLYEGKMRSECAVEFYLSKMPDSTAYSEAGGYYLSNCSMVGKNSKGVIGYHFLRTRMSYYSSIEPETILCATYSFKTFSKDSQDFIYVTKNKEKWSSGGMSWGSKPNFEQEYMDVKMNKDYVVADITEYAKDSMGLFGDKLEYRGLAILSNSSEPIYFATSDNTKYPPYVTLYLSELPESFTPHSDINGAEK